MYLKILLTDESRSSQNGTILFFDSSKYFYMLLNGYNEFGGTEESDFLKFSGIVQLFNIK